MIRINCNKTEVEGINRILGQKKTHYNLQDILDLLASEIYVGTEDDGISYDLNIIPGYREGKYSGWTISYNKDDSYYSEEYKDFPAVLCAFSDNNGLLETALKTFYWVYEYTSLPNYADRRNTFRKLFITHDEPRLFKAMDDAVNTWKEHKEQTINYEN